MRAGDGACKGGGHTWDLPNGRLDVLELDAMAIDLDLPIDASGNDAAATCREHSGRNCLSVAFEAANLLAAQGTPLSLDGDEHMVGTGV